ncbi:hypothetical protein C8A05DRAFT_43742 [Staphylotrichum tortipilum]|uniref:Pre-mRNA-processing factor 19 n=1 Tax=Staphylotrichum tortipilum TaxID=2831512 RepID=A0AAN6MN76_9PEZI|nr:hypothetical protein C8A05DRAFT_43742 [Staphylotrichum longicolle]
MATPQKLDFITLDVFTPNPFLGNPLAVVLLPTTLSPPLSQSTKQKIAREFNLSETAFLHTPPSSSSPTTSSLTLDIFTPTTELPFAGHPTIGTAHFVLHHLSQTHVTTLQTKAGPIPISPSSQGGGVRAAIPHAVHIHAQTLGRVLPLGPSAATYAIETGLSRDGPIRAAELAAPVVSIVRGMTFVLVQLKNLEQLGRAAEARGIDFDEVGGLLDEGEWEGGFVARYYYVLVDGEGADGEVGIRTRMVELDFEDPATGSAACTLACYLAVKAGGEGGRYRITQGVEMGRESEIVVDVVVCEEGGERSVKEVYLEGTAVVVMNGISGEVPEEPVVSKKTGIVYEKRLILKYIQEHGTEPGTSDELDAEHDLLPVKTSRVVRPRPPNFTSLPSLLKAFQDEWDALVLETHNTREQLARTREELATALYQHDAAVRVIARLTRERDEARDALAKVTIAPTAGAGAANGDAMAVDNEGLPENLVEHVQELQQQLMKGRKKRPIPQGWATADDVAALGQTAYVDLSVTQASSLDTESGYAVIGGLDGKADIYSVAANTVERTLEIGEAVTATVWTGSKVVVATAKGAVRVFDGGSEAASFRVHAGAVTGLAVHPGGRILASVGADKSFVFYDLEALAHVSRGYTDSALTACAFHPDGNLFGAGTQSGDIKIFQTATGAQAESFSLGSPVQAVVFSENGFWFAAAGKGQLTTAIFDLRKSGPAALVRELQTGEARALAWDYTGQFLATAGAEGVTVQMYAKSAKAWSEPLRVGKPAVAVRWGGEARALVVVSGEGVVSVLGEKGE